MKTFIENAYQNSIDYDQSHISEGITRGQRLSSILENIITKRAI